MQPNKIKEMEQDLYAIIQRRGLAYTTGLLIGFVLRTAERDIDLRQRLRQLIKQNSS